MELLRLAVRWRYGAWLLVADREDDGLADQGDRAGFDGQTYTVVIARPPRARPVKSLSSRARNSVVSLRRNEDFTAARFTTSRWLMNSPSTARRTSSPRSRRRECGAHRLSCSAVWRLRADLRCG